MRAIIEAAHASMRPRHKAAENYEGEFRDDMPNGASMRPRHKAAENRVAGLEVAPLLGASMRPRHKAAENRESEGTPGSRRRGFNEAAA